MEYQSLSGFITYHEIFEGDPVIYKGNEAGTISFHPAAVRSRRRLRADEPNVYFLEGGYVAIVSPWWSFSSVSIPGLCANTTPETLVVSDKVFNELIDLANEPDVQPVPRYFFGLPVHVFAHLTKPRQGSGRYRWSIIGASPAQVLATRRILNGAPTPPAPPSTPLVLPSVPETWYELLGLKS